MIYIVGQDAVVTGCTSQFFGLEDGIKSLGLEFLSCFPLGHIIHIYINISNNKMRFLFSISSIMIGILK